MELVATTIVLLILILVVTLLVTNTTSRFKREIQDCTAHNGLCESGSECSKGQKSSFYVCYDEEEKKTDEICCVGQCLEAGGECQPRCNTGQREIPATECQQGTRCCVNE